MRPSEVVFLFDVDNTLLDNDRVNADLRRYLEREVGPDQAGPMTRSVRDAAIMLRAMASHDPKDSTSVPRPVPDYERAMTGDVRGLKFGIPKEYRLDGMAEERAGDGQPPRHGAHAQQPGERGGEAGHADAASASSTSRSCGHASAPGA